TTSGESSRHALRAVRFRPRHAERACYFPTARKACLLLSLAGFRLGSAEVAEDGGGAVGVLDAVERDVADELRADDGHAQRLHVQTSQGPLLCQAVGQAGSVVA